MIPSPEARETTRAARPFEASLVGGHLRGSRALVQASASPAAAPALYCPFASAISPLADEVNDASVAWAERVGLIAGERSAAALRGAKVGSLVSRAFPAAERRALQIASDWTVLFCLLDDITERAGARLLPTSALYERLLRVFLGQELPSSDEGVAVGLADLRQRMLEAGGAGLVARFARRLEQLFAGFLMESAHRSLDIVPDPWTYLKLREITVGLHAEFELHDLMGSPALPEHLREDALLGALAAKAANLVGWANDLATYEKEALEGDWHNLVLVLAASEQVGLHEAIARVVAMHDDEVRSFVALAAELPAYGADQAAVVAYVDMLTAWVRGHLDWAGETGRYRPAS